MIMGRWRICWTIRTLHSVTEIITPLRCTWDKNSTCRDQGDIKGGTCFLPTLHCVERSRLRKRPGRGCVLIDPLAKQDDGE